MPPFVRKPSMLGDPSVVAGWRFLSADSATATPRATLQQPQQPQQPQPPRSQHNDVENFLKAAEGQLWHDAEVDEDALVDRVEALLGGPETAGAEPLQLPQIPSSAGRGDGPAEELSDGDAGEVGGGVDFENYTYGSAAGGVRESLGGSGAAAAAAAVPAGGAGAGLSAESMAEPGDPGTPAAAERPASQFDDHLGASAVASGGGGGGGGGGTEPGVGVGGGSAAIAGMSRVGRTPRGARTGGQVVPLPAVAVDSSFTYTPRQARSRPARYGAWYLPINSWQKGGAPKPPPQLTKEEKEKIEETSLKRAKMDAAIKTKAAPPAFKEFLRHQRACEALEVLEQAKSVFGDGQLDEFAAIKNDFISYKLSSRELQKRIRELLAGGPIHRQQLGLQVSTVPT
jgi:hypothetical protein